MTLTAALRDRVRHRAGGACEFCGTIESDAGGELTIDHYRPTSREGTDDPDNLVYCCIRCNQYKGDYWPDIPDAPCLWNPREGAFSDHFLELDGGILHPLTSSAAFTLERLRLNRPALVARRNREHQYADRERLLRSYRRIIEMLEELIHHQNSVIEEQQRLLVEQQELLRHYLDSE